jgi:hypothetical protein
MTNTEASTAAIAAVDELRRLRCTDPAAAEAMAVVRLTIQMLERWWLPADEV